ncbi:glycerophosphoryl diester phosphodiesterase [Hallella multisaccharivorax DSM 17128]|uniref:Glycerophosphoryl diester phosphodiesterase n=1 Tax=Hallella multisaccharivorax DSM 17128 TaxID=688246 RepID=F8N736_9BACT|nr:glycerophosphodiester phosphodiesterase family protein [Hallella multisaccharivorax]EGN56334.1 glycerophosphoryl diester phosphodiesterase [Hallella multisaccharivorax DSM 17128]GJG29847.1 glycerophosphoryl diester phosphodiesterase [Hallella multisaccharivorax DSM 17128]
MKHLTVFAVVVLFAMTVSAQTKIVAHRGYWDCAGSAQNSVTSLKLADKIGVYGSEFDVHLTKDNVIVIHHDPTAKTPSGKELDIQTSTLKELRKVKLKNGEKIPTLNEYLETGKDLGCRLVLEIKKQKMQSHEDSLVRETVDMVKAKGMENRMVWISFSGKACELLRLLLPNANIQYLNGDWDPQTVKAKGLNGIDYNEKVLALHPEWIKECHDLGLVVNVWTVNDLNDIDQFIKAGVDIITTNKPVEALKLSK